MYIRKVRTELYTNVINNLYHVLYSLISTIVTIAEASLGFMSGAKAKKEAERSRSSYFKNK